MNNWIHELFLPGNFARFRRFSGNINRFLHLFFMKFRESYFGSSASLCWPAMGPQPGPPRGAARQVMEARDLPTLMHAYRAPWASDGSFPRSSKEETEHRFRFESEWLIKGMDRGVKQGQWPQIPSFHVSNLDTVNRITFQRKVQILQIIVIKNAQLQ